MKYLRKFETPAERQSYLDKSIVPELPYVHYVNSSGDVFYSTATRREVMSNLPLFIEALEDLAVRGPIDNSFEYSMDNSSWESANYNVYIRVPKGKAVFLRASNVTVSGTYGIGTFKIEEGKGNVGGNIMSLLYGEDFIGKTELYEYSFKNLFSGAKNLVNASSLILPAGTLKTECYSGMFLNCTNLVSAPELPATTLAKSCYQSMFNSCTSLANAPELPATSISSHCYHSMFDGCTSLINAPKLPAMVIGSYSYASMFDGCTSLVNAPELPATTIRDSGYSSMFYGCTSLVNAPALPATTLAVYCYSFMFNGCTSLVNAPELPAINLKENCYWNMFFGCSNLSYVKAMFKTTPSSSYTLGWLSGVAAEGTFVKNAEATWDVTGVEGIPEGWTVETAEA